MVRSAPAQRPARRRRRPLVVLLVVLVVLVGLLLAADRIGRHVAQGVAATRLQDAQHLAHKPSVDVAGFPFLTQLAAGHYDTITVTAHDLEVGDSGRQVRLDTLRTVLHGVRTSDSFHRVRAATLTATGSTTLAQVAAATGLRLSAAGGGRVATTRSALGVDVTVSAKPVVRGGELVFEQARLEDAGSVLGGLSGDLASLFRIAVPLRGIPFGLTARSVTVTGGQVAFTLDGSDVDLSSG